MKRRVVGAVAWIVAGLALLPAAASLPGAETLIERAWDRAVGGSKTVEARFETPSGLAVGDPVLRFDADALVHVGRVFAIRAGTPEVVVMEIDGFDARRMGADAFVRALSPGSNLGWALDTLTPSDLRARVASQLTEVFAREGEAALAEVAPAARERLRDVVDALIAALPDAFEAERAAWTPVVERLRRDVWDATLAPIADAALWPQVRAACSPPAAELADELVRELGFGALFRGAWARTKDAAGVGDERAFEAEIERIVTERVAPVVRRRAPSLADAATQALKDTWAREDVRAAVDRAVEIVLADAEARAVLSRILRRACVDDPRVREVWRAAVDDPRFRAAASRVARAAEPIFESAIRDALLRDDAQGLDLRLVRVLRNVLLWKDRRYALLDRGAAPSPLTGPLRGVVD